MSQQLKVVVSVDAERPEEVTEIAANLSEAGLSVDDVLVPLCTITGTCEQGSMSSLERVPGVLVVERQHEFQLPPGEEDLQ
ncbi:MAG: hypothetical protein ACRDQ7_15525 [Haloechinothrix sp.]